MWSRAEINSDSNYTILTRWIDVTSALRPDWRYYVVWPDKASEFQYVDDGFFARHRGRVVRLVRTSGTRRMVEVVSYDARWWDRLFKTTAFDVILNNLVEISGPLKVAGAGSYSSDQTPFIVNYHHYVIHHSLPYPAQSVEHAQFAQVAGALFADVNVMHSQHCENMLHDAAEFVLAPAQRKRLEIKLTRIPLGLLSPREFPEPDRGDHTEPWIVYNHRLQLYKQYKATFAVLDELAREGVKFRVRFPMNSPDMVGEIRKFPFVDVVPDCERRENYLRELQRCDLNTLNSLHETFCIAAVESMAFGQPIVAPRAATFPELLAGVHDYPFLFNNEADQKNFLRRLITEPTMRREWGARLRQSMLARYSDVEWGAKWVALFERLMAERPVASGSEVIEWVAGILRARFVGKPMMDAAHYLHTAKLDGRIALGTQALSPTKALRLFRACGLDVTLDPTGTQVIAESRKEAGPVSADPALQVSA